MCLWLAACLLASMTPDRRNSNKTLMQQAEKYNKRATQVCFSTLAEIESLKRQAQHCIGAEHITSRRRLKTHLSFHIPRPLLPAQNYCVP